MAAHENEGAVLFRAHLAVQCAEDMGTEGGSRTATGSRVRRCRFTSTPPACPPALPPLLQSLNLLNACLRGSIRVHLWSFFSTAAIISSRILC